MVTELIFEALVARAKRVLISKCNSQLVRRFLLKMVVLRRILLELVIFSRDFADF
jgi:hypothetical protein